MNRRGFLKSLICAIAGKSLPILSALTTPRVAASITGYLYCDYIPILCTPTFLDPRPIAEELILSGRLRGSL